MSPALQNQFTNTSCNLNNLKYAYPLSHIPINTSLAKGNAIQCKQSFKNLNEKYLARRETQFNKPYFTPNRRHPGKISKSHYPKIASVLFASNHSQIQLHKSSPKLNHIFNNTQMLIIPTQINTTWLLKSELQESASPTPHAP